MKVDAKYIVTGLAAFILATPLWAHTYKEPWTVSSPVVIGSTKVQPGSYQLQADDSKQELTIQQNGKVMATVSGQWIKLPKKADYAEVVNDSGKVTQVEFGGSDKAFQPQ